MKTTLVIGASTNPQRYSNIAVKRLIAKGEKVIALGLKEGEIDDVPILTGKPDLEEIHTISLYLNESRQKEYYEYLFSLKPQRIIFNPGTENIELMQMTKERGIEAEFSCMLVMLSTGSY